MEGRGDTGSFLNELVFFVGAGDRQRVAPGLESEDTGLGSHRVLDINSMFARADRRAHG